MSSHHHYPGSARFFHWLMATLIISMLCLGASMVQSLAPWQVTALALHKSFGVLVLLLVVLRLLNRLSFNAPPMPADLLPVQAFAAKATQLGLYAAMIAMPLSGWLMQNADGRLVSVFGLFDLAVLMAADIERYSLFRGNARPYCRCVYAAYRGAYKCGFISRAYSP